MLSLLVVIVCLPQLIQCHNYATCSASCSNDSHNDTLLLELLNVTRSNEQSIKETREAVDGIIRSLSIIKNTTTSNAGAINDVLLLVKDLLMLHNETSYDPSPLPTSCEEVKNKQPNNPSGMYLLETPNNGTINTYCNMEELCGSGGGWTRLAYLDMSDSTVNCPSGFRLYQSGGVRACGRPVTSSGSCVSVEFPSNGISYSQVCGRVTGYQYGRPDAIRYSTYPYRKNLNSYYVDGVSITRGSPRQHVWTLIAGLNEASNYIHARDGRYNCPCSQGSPQNSTLQSFIGNDYFCESGNPVTDGTFQYRLYASDPLWDGKGCGSLEGVCCAAPGLPWFNKILNTTTTDYLELRVCGDERTISSYELYVK